MPAAAMPAATLLFLAGNAVAMTGNGLVLAFTLIYLHQARGIALPVVGLLLAAGAAAGLLAVTGSADGPTRSPPSPSPWRSSSALHLLPASSPPVRPQSGSACYVPAASAPSPSGPGFAAP